MRDDYTQWLARGQAHQLAGRPIDAMVCYRRALNSNAHSVVARCGLGEVLHELGRSNEARATWRAGLAFSPRHVRLLLSLANDARRSGAHAEAIDGYRRVLAKRPQDRRARFGFVLSRIASGEQAACMELPAMLDEGALAIRPNEVVSAIAAAPRSAGRTALLLDLAASREQEMPPMLLALALEEMVAGGAWERARAALDRAEARASSIENPETLRRLALVAASVDATRVWAEHYARRCAERFAPNVPLLLPRRSAGEALRVGYVIAPGTPVAVEGTKIEVESYLCAVVAGHSRKRIAATVYVVGALGDASMLESAGVPVVALGASPDPSSARVVAESDNDVLIDLVGLNASLGPLLAQKPARTLWSYAGQVAGNVAPLVTRTLEAPRTGDERALTKHRAKLESVLLDACTSEPWFALTSARSAGQLAAAWRAAVAAHQDNDVDTAIERYRDLLAEQAGHAAAHHLLGTLLQGRGMRNEAEQAFTAALAAAPTYVEARVALANVYVADGRTGSAVDLCEAGLELQADQVSLWRGLGLARLAQRNARLAHKAFKRALALAPGDADTHYNQGVALQMAHRRDAALRAYQRALALESQLIAADFNIGVIFREQGHTDAAVNAFKHVLSRDPRHVHAFKALAETLLAERRLDEWFKVFDSFEAACPDALPLAVLALQAYQYRGDFAAVDRYLNRLQRDEFKATSETELADCLEELLFLLLYFDFEPEAHFELYKAYDAVVPRVYGRPAKLPAERRPGPIRIGYLSGDLRNHVMGKMMWSAIERHDRQRFELYFYSLSTANDEWTARYRGLTNHFELLADLSEREAAERIAADDIDVLVDLATNTYGAKPGILAHKPARVQITHVASAGLVGLSAIDFKLTDALSDVSENQQTQLETLLPMEGCVYPYRHIDPAEAHPFHRDRLGLAPDAIVIGCFVNPLKLSRRCLALWREILERIPTAKLAVSPLSPEMRGVFARLFDAAGISHGSVMLLPQGRNEGESQARYNVIDFTLDPMPYGGANGTLEALDMGVPVVTLVGRKHGERSTYSILSNLGVTQTAATSGSEYVEIAVRLATDPGFMAEVRAAIRTGLERSVLVDMDAHARHLEAAYLRALEQRYPVALHAARNG